MAPDECSSQITPKRNDAQIEGRKKNHPPTPSLLVRYQLVFFGKVARAPDEDVLRKLTFCPGSLDLAANRFIRRVGRPRNEWAPCLLKEALRIVGSTAALETLIRRP